MGKMWGCKVESVDNFIAENPPAGGSACGLSMNLGQCLQPLLHKYTTPCECSTSHLSTQ